MVSCAIGEDGGIENLTAGATFPGIERTNEIIELLSVHSTFAFWTPHVFPPFRLCVIDLLTVRCCVG